MKRVKKNRKLKEERKEWEELKERESDKRAKKRDGKRVEGEEREELSTE